MPLKMLEVLEAVGMVEGPAPAEGGGALADVPAAALICCLFSSLVLFSSVGLGLALEAGSLLSFKPCKQYSVRI